MGQKVAITRLPSRPEIVRWEANRNFTGMGHERYRVGSPVVGDTPSAKVAQLLLDTGKVAAVHVYGNIIDVDLAKGRESDGLDDIVSNMYQYWTPGRELPVFSDEPATESSAAAVAAGAADGAGGGPSAYEQRVPSMLRERSAAALARWKANH